MLPVSNLSQRLRRLLVPKCQVKFEKSEYYSV